MFQVALYIRQKPDLAPAGVGSHLKVEVTERLQVCENSVIVTFILIVVDRRGFDESVLPRPGMLGV